MKQIIIIVISITASVFCFVNNGMGQIINVADTLSIDKGSFIFIPADMKMVDSNAKSSTVINNGAIKISGNFISSPHAIYTGTSDSLVLTGKDSQNFPGFSYYRLVADSGGHKYMNGNVYIRNRLSLIKGIIETGNDTIRLDSLAEMNEDTGDYVVGNTSISRYLKAGFDYTSGNIGLETAANSNEPGYTTIFRKTGTSAIQKGFCSHGIGQYFDVKPASSGNLGEDLVLYYFPFELNGIRRADLQLFRSLDSGKTWQPMNGNTINDSFINAFVFRSTDTLARFTLGSSARPLINALSPGKPQTICSGDPVQLGDSATGNHLYHWQSDPPGFSSTLPNPVVNPTRTTTYYLQEIVPSTACTHSDSVTIFVRPQPHAGWKITGDCPEYSFMANDTGFIHYQWEFGDGATDMGFNVKHAYAADSVYHIRLTVTDQDGCSAQNDSAAYFNVNSTDLKVFPNPFTTDANIQFMLCGTSNVHIALFDTRGREIETIVDDRLSEGLHRYKIHLAKPQMRDGLYLLRMKIDDKTTVNKIIGFQ